MKIGFDAKRAYYNTSGLGNYSRGVIQALNTYYPNVEQHLFAPLKNQVPYSEIQNLGMNHFFKGPFKNFARIFGTSTLGIKNQLDIFHGLSNEIPSGLQKASIKSVVTVHDLIFLKFPEYYSSFDRKIYLAKTKYAVKNADLIITTSEQTKQDLETHFKVGAKCTTIYQHISQFTDNQTENSIIIEDYILYISSFEQRKNHLNLLKGFLEVKDSISANLVLIGRKKNTATEVEEFIKKHELQNRIKIIYNADSVLLKQYLKKAKCFIYPSFYEGFGIPLLEAMQFQLPIACSKINVFEELAQQFAHYFDPNSPKSIGNAITQLDSQQKLTNRNAELVNHLKIFSAKSHAEQLVNSYKSLIS